MHIFLKRVIEQGFYSFRQSYLQWQQFSHHMLARKAVFAPEQELVTVKDDLRHHQLLVGGVLVKASYLLQTH